MDQNIIEYYKTHNNKETRKKFDISYNELKSICKKYNFKKSKEQIRTTYKNTKISKHGSLAEAYKAMVAAKEETILNNYGSYDLYYEIRNNNTKKTNNKVYGTDYPMQNEEVIIKANNTKEKHRRK